jgi:catalase
MSDRYSFANLTKPASLVRLGGIGVGLLAIAGAFAATAGWLLPDRLDPERLIDRFETVNGEHPGFRRNHAKGICLTGWFESNGNGARLSTASVFARGRLPVIGRFALAGGLPMMPDGPAAVRSLALEFLLPDGQQWRTGMNDMPVFPVSTPRAFYQMLQAQQPDPSSHKPDPRKLAAFFAAHPETAAFLAWAKTAKPSASFATQSYWSLDAFQLVDGHGRHHPVRWRMVPEAPAGAPETPGGGGAGPGGSPDYLAADLRQRLAQAPLRWHLLITLAQPGDPTDDAAKEWPPDRRSVDAGTLVLTSTQPQQSGLCRDINYDPLVLPHGIEASGDPLLPARSAAYADSYLRRTSEEAHLPGYLRGTPSAATQPDSGS